MRAAHSNLGLLGRGEVGVERQHMKRGLVGLFLVIRLQRLQSARATVLSVNFVVIIAQLAVDLIKIFQRQ